MKRCRLACWYAVAPMTSMTFYPSHGAPPHPRPMCCRDTYVKQDPGESPNDRNDRAIRRAAEWYSQRLPGKPILLLTDDAGNRTKAIEAGVEAMSCAVRGACRGEQWGLAWRYEDRVRCLLHWVVGCGPSYTRAAWFVCTLGRRGIRAPGPATTSSMSPFILIHNQAYARLREDVPELSDLVSAGLATQAEQREG